MIQIKELTAAADDATFGALTDLFREMYSYMNEHGLNLKLAPDGDKKWVNSMKKTLGKINFISVAFKDDKLIGFGVASIRLAPDYLNSLKIGAISHIYISPQLRSKGVGELILAELENWLKSKNVNSIELEVLFRNSIGINFWKKNLYTEELLKMRKLLS